MSNRQARREQSRAQRAQRAAGRGRASRRPGGGGRRPGGTSWLTQPFTLIAVGVTLILAIVLGVVLVLTGGGESDDAVVALEQAREDIPVEMASGLKLGSDDAPLKLTQYEDFQCPFCLRYTANQEPTLIEEYVKTGKMQLIFQHFPGLGLESQWAANASSCAADQNMFWEYANQLFLRQAEEGQLETEVLNRGRFDLERLKEMGADIGIPDRESFDRCVDDLEHQDDIIDHERRARSLGINGTPGFLLNDLPLTTAGAISTLDEWRSVLDQALEQVENPTPAPPAETATPEPDATAAEDTATPEPTATAAE